jgi:hypothetical protein
LITLGRGGGIRTHGPSLPKRVRYQAALHPVAASLGARDGDRGGGAASRPGSPARPGHRTRSSPILSPARGRCGRPRCRRSRWPRARCSSRLLSSMLAGLPIVARSRCLPWGIGKRSRPADRSSRSVKTSPATHSRDAVATPGFPTAPGWATGPGVGRASATVEEASSVTRGRSSMVEPQSSKLATRVRFPSPAPRRSRRSVRYRPRRRTAGP